MEAANPTHYNLQIMLEKKLKLDLVTKEKKGDRTKAEMYMKACNINKVFTFLHFIVREAVS